jgi:hypothetical protein
MPRDDREQNFEKALAGSFRSSSSQRANEANDCLDAETLAAYHEHLLDPDEMAQRKTHIASCERCQEILAQLEATDAIPVEADRDLLLDQIVLDLPEAEPAEPVQSGAAEETVVAKEAVPMAQTPPSNETAPPIETSPTGPALEPASVQKPELVAAAAPSMDLSRPATLFPSAAKSAPSSSTITFRDSRPDRPKLVRFVALAGALAAGLIFWLVYREQTNKNFELAQNRPASKLELPPQSPPPSAEDKTATPSSQTSTPDALSHQNAAPQNALTPPAATPAPKPASPQAVSEADAVTNALKDAKKTVDSAKALEEKSRAGGLGGRAERRDESTAAGGIVIPRAVLRTAPDTGTRKLEAANESQIDSAIAAANLPSGIPSPPPPARTKMNPSVITESVSVDAAVPAAQLSATAQAETLSKPVNGRIVATLSPLSVPAPGGTTIWRIGQAGMIQRSTDSGTTWSIQPSGVVSDLIAGSAYSDQICWLVGRNGTILRTTNGGITWQKLTSPSNVDLLSIFAINADSATITDAAGRAFETTSAGARWTRTRLQQ